MNHPTTLEITPALARRLNDNEWVFRDDVATWIIGNLTHAPRLEVVQESKWMPKHRVHLSSLDVKVHFGDADDALFFKVAWF
ncbi:MAG: hypothetical protein EOP84_16010 [Verrucomicrobiaceae bacterium]|nr:MAG: hypothetical protein EOP84_16010 [Verrucomicrobiaceae bacterium]